MTKISFTGAFARAALLAALGTAALGAGCAQTNTSGAQTPDDTGTLQVDSAAVAGVYDDEDDLVGSGAAALSGAAVWDTLTVAQWMVLAATTPEERTRADEAAASGAYLGDPRLAVRLQPGDEPGTASAAIEDAVGTAFETEVLHRFDGGGGQLDLTFSGEPAGEGRRMPSLLRVSFFLDAEPSESRVVVYVGDREGEPSELARASLPQDVDRGTFAHRFDVQYEPGQIVVFLDGTPVVEAAARLGGGPMTAAVTAAASADTRAYLLQWVLDTGE
ncbi:MAG TPA: hypothetical protein VK002_15580 [Rubricoccaceae bacterium]|nr:hypothetical protein [Rubricoccaceae bacterium]